MAVYGLVAAEIEHLLVDVAPAPRLPGIAGCHDRMACRMIRPGRVPVYVDRAITVTDVTTLAARVKKRP